MTTAARATGSRIASIDVLRGLTIAGMLLVNDPGDPAFVFAQVRHRAWNGISLADLVFPFFLFVVGITTQLSLSRRMGSEDDPRTILRAVARRAMIIFVLGLLLNAYPFYEKSAVAGPPWLPLPFGHIAARLSELRITGVLQRIGVTYAVVALITWRGSARRVALTAAVLLLGYWILMTVVPVPGEYIGGQPARGMQLLDAPGHTLAAYVDRSLLDWTRFGLGWHLWDRSVPYDPEGVLSTLPAIASVLLGVLGAMVLQRPTAIAARLRTLAFGGGVAMSVGALWSIWLPFNKSLWSSSYALFAAGAAALTLAAIGWLVDVRQQTRWTKPLLVFGTNPIVAYVGAELLANVLRSSIKWKVNGHRIGTGLAVTQALEAAGVEAHVASLLWAVLFVALCYAVLRPLHRRGWLVKI